MINRPSAAAMGMSASDSEEGISLPEGSLRGYEYETKDTFIMCI